LALVFLGRVLAVLYLGFLAIKKCVSLALRFKGGDVGEGNRYLDRETIGKDTIIQ
jgi:hypothetical protein